MRAVTTLLDLLGCAVALTGVAMWSVPAALIGAGVALLAASWRLTGGRS